MTRRHSLDVATEWYHRGKLDFEFVNLRISVEFFR